MKIFLIAISCAACFAAGAQVSFSRMPNQPPANMYSVVTDPASGDIYACTLNSILRSVDQGASWTQVANPAMNLVNVLYFSATGQLYAGGTANNVSLLNGITKYNKVSNTWTVMSGSPLNVTTITDDGAGNVYAGTGSTGNTLPNPVNFGTGVYLFNGTTWSAMNTGMANLTGYSVLPFIKDLKILSNGNMVAATYGNGVIKYNAGSWSQYGTGLTNSNVNCLFINASNNLFAGTDVNVCALNGTLWNNTSTGLTANKPVRALIADASGTMYAGLGFYVYQKGSIKGEIFYSTNNAALWQNAAAGFNSTGVVSMALHSSGTIFAAANGIWKTASPNNWTYAMATIPVANNTHQMIQNQQGDWFAICRNSGGAVPGCAGVFRSTDKGVTWVSINNGINCQKIDVILADSQGWLWLATKEFIGASLNPAFGNPELYYSADNGNTWIKENTIETTSDGFNQMAEDGQGRLFVTESFNGLSTNISSSTSHGAFLNNLQPPPNNGGKSFGLAINSQHHIFHGTETTPGLYRSTANGVPGSFVSLATPGVGYAPNGNVGVFIDPYTDYIFCDGTHGLYNSTVLSKSILGSTNIDNGTNMFIFNNLPDYVSLTSVIFDNNHHGYFSINGSPLTTGGLYTASAPWDSTTVFNRVISNGALSYYFNGFMIDDCGYLYGVGGGISRSGLPVNTPLQSTLVYPANAANGIPVTPVLIWSHKCIPDSFRLQIATDSLFTAIVADQPGITTTNYTVLPGTLLANKKYYWRVYAVNTAGVGKWSTVNNFTTTSTLAVRYISFNGKYNDSRNTTDLAWTTVNETNNHHFDIEKSTGGIVFTVIGTIPASSASNTQNTYQFNDNAPLAGSNFYRIRQVDFDGKYSYSKIITVTVKNMTGELVIFPNPVKDISTLQLPALSVTGYSIVIRNEAGAIIFSTKSKMNEKTIDLDMRQFSPGLYSIRVTNIRTGASTGKKMVKTE